LANTEVSRAAAAELGLVRVCMEQPNSDISAYTYERTLLMEQRHAMLAQMKIKKKNSLTVILNTSHASYVRMAVRIPPTSGVLKIGATHLSTGLSACAQRSRNRKLLASQKFDFICRVFVTGWERHVPRIVCANVVKIRV